MNDKPAIAYVGLGSNIGDRAAMMLRALDMLDEQTNLAVRLVSQFVETEPEGGPPNQNNYLNAAAEVCCETTATEMLKKMQSVENMLGRQRSVKWAARTIDIDLLLFDEQIIKLPNLQVPHPLMHARKFVMGPMVEIAPDLIHPILTKTMTQILGQLKG